MRILLTLVFLCMGLVSSHASLTGTEIKKLVTNKKIVLSTAYGKFPLRYWSNRTVTGDGSKTGLVRFFAPRETGKWWVRGKQLCQRWPTWYDGKPFCFTVEKIGPRRIKWVRSDGYTGTARIY